MRLHYTPLGWPCRGEVVIDQPYRRRCVECGRTGLLELPPERPAPVLVTYIESEAA